jgi:putative redox protein
VGVATRRPSGAVRERTGPVTTMGHLARVFASTGTATPPYRVDIRAGRHQIISDEPASAGGGDLGLSPFGLLLSALAACTATTLRMYAERKGWELTTIDLDVRFDLDDHNALAIVRIITLPVDLPAEQRERLAEMAERTPVTRAIRGATPIRTTFTTPNA